MNNAIRFIDSKIYELDAFYRVANLNMKEVQEKINSSDDATKCLADIDFYFQEQMIINFIKPIFIKLKDVEITPAVIETVSSDVQDRIYTHTHQIEYIEGLRDFYRQMCRLHSIEVYEDQIFYYRKQIKLNKMERQYCIQALSDLDSILDRL